MTNAFTGVDPHKDAGVEPLHTYLLGQDKYVWHETSKSWNEALSDRFTIQLQSSSIDGLTLPPLKAAFIVQYKNSLNGKHFKALQQLAIFHMDDDLCPKPLFDLWRYQGELGALLWFPEIHNMTEYLVRLQSLCSLSYQQLICSL